MTFRSFGRVALALAFSLGLATLPTSCGGGHAIGYTFVLSNDPCGVFIYSINSGNGALSPGSTPSVDCPGTTSNPVGAVVSPDYKNLFVLFGPAGEAGTIQAYSINQSNGSLSSLQTYTTAGNSSTALAIDPGGKYLYAVDTFAGNQDSGPGVVSFFNVAGGALTVPSCGGGTVVNGACSYPVGYHPSQANQLFNGTYVYITNFGNSSIACSGTVSGFAVTKTGLTPIAFAVPKNSCPGGGNTPVPSNSLPMGTQPLGITSDPTSSFVYITDYQQSSVYANQVDPTTGNIYSTTTGGTTGLGSYPVAQFPQNVIVDPRGQYVYVTNSGANTITAFVLNKSSGALSAVSGSPYLTGSQPLCLGVEPLQGDYLYVVNKLSGNVSGYKLTGNTGQLTATPNQPYAVSSSSASSPSCLVVAANGPTPIAGTP